MVAQRDRMAVAVRLGLGRQGVQDGWQHYRHGETLWAGFRFFAEWFNEDRPWHPGRPLRL